MEYVIVTKTRCIGLDDDEFGQSNLSYLKELPNYFESLGGIYKETVNLLSKQRKKELLENQVYSIRFPLAKPLKLGVGQTYILYKLQAVDPVFCDNFGLNSIINPKKHVFPNIPKLESFFRDSQHISPADFELMERETNYIVTSYYEGEAATIYTNDLLADEIISLFNSLCKKNTGKELTIESLDNAD